MAVQEYEYIKNYINEHQLETVLEWGAGGSTIWFPNQCPSVKSWIAIEHSQEYIDYLKPKANAVVELLYKSTSDEYLDIKGKYDLILIDGLYRDECLKKGLQLLNPKGIIFLHDSGRKAYKDWYEKFPHEIVFEGEGWLGDGWDHRGLASFKNA